MNILYVITGLGLGGAEKVVVDLADQMILLGHDVKIAYLTGEVLVKPVSEIELINLNLNSSRSLLVASKCYKKLLNQFQPDIVHAHMIHANIFARLNRFLFPLAKLICTAHSSNEGGKARMLAYRLTNWLSNINTNVSQTATDSLISKGAFSQNNLITVYNGIDLSKFEKNAGNNTDLDNNFTNLMAVGRLTDAKDYPNLINAFAELKRDTITNVRLTIVGDGELRYAIEALIKDLQLEKDIILLGRRSDIPQLLNQADIFVLASKFEGFGLVVAEAMACGCYVVATDSGGVAEVMGNTGQLVHIKDSHALAKSLEKAISLSGEDIMYNNKKARTRVEQLFSLETSVQKWLALYEAE